MGHDALSQREWGLGLLPDAGERSSALGRSDPSSAVRASHRRCARPKLARGCRNADRTGACPGRECSACACDEHLEVHRSRHWRRADMRQRRRVRWRSHDRLHAHQGNCRPRGQRARHPGRGRRYCAALGQQQSPAKRPASAVHRPGEPRRYGQHHRGATGVLFDGNDRGSGRCARQSKLENDKLQLRSSKPGCLAGQCGGPFRGESDRARHVAPGGLGLWR